MPDIRGKCKQDLERAALLAHHVQEHLAWIVKEYADHPDFSGPVEVALTSASSLESYLKEILPEVP